MLGCTKVYSQHNLLEIGFHSESTVTVEFIHSHNIPADIARSLGAPWIIIPEERRCKRRNKRRRKRGCRAGVLAMLRRSPHKLPLPSIFLANTRCQANKMDELRLQVSTNNTVKDCCVLILTENWLHSSITDVAIELADRTLHRWDRTADSGKSRGGRLCVYKQQLGHWH